MKPRESSPQGEDERLVSRTRGFLSEEALPAAMRLGIYRDCETGKSSPQGEDERLVSRTRGFLSEEALPADLKIMERTILLTIEYDGTGFSGWQRQPGKRTVQGELERVLSVLCAGPVQIDGSGRTDAGVHALGQCASFSGEFSIPTESIAKAANDMLAESRLRGGDQSHFCPGSGAGISCALQRQGKEICLSDQKRRADAGLSAKLSLSCQDAAGYRGDEGRPRRL